MRRERTRKVVTTFVLGPITSVVETIRGLRKMSLAADDDGAAATPSPPY